MPMAARGLLSLPAPHATEFDMELRASLAHSNIVAELEQLHKVCAGCSGDRMPSTLLRAPSRDPHPVFFFLASNLAFFPFCAAHFSTARDGAPGVLLGRPGPRGESLAAARRLSLPSQARAALQHARVSS